MTIESADAAQRDQQLQAVRVAYLEAAEKGSSYSQFQIARQQYFLGLAYARLARLDEARATLDKAIKSAGSADWFWGPVAGIDQEELALLRAEAEKVLTKV